MNDEDLDYCGMCGELENECVCDLVILMVDENPDFVWEFCHELGSYEHTVFRKILPDD